MTLSLPSTVPAQAPESALRPILLIHGMWMTALCWEFWVERYRAKGYDVVAPSWPGLDREVEELRRDPTPIAALSVTGILERYEAIIRAMPRSPILMGHSFGGAFVQVLLSRGLGAAGVAIHSGPVRGVLDLPLTTLRVSWPLLRNPLARHRAIPITAEQFRYAFTHPLSEEASLLAYERYAIPGSRSVLLEGANANVNPRTALRVDFEKQDRAPLLFVAGGDDRVVPSSMNRSNAEKYEPSSVTELREYAGRSHFTLGQPGWESVADDALSWANEQISQR